MKKIIITGKVQGVFFRYLAEKKAQELNIKGTVRNLPDGSLEIIAKGDDEDMEKFIDWCKLGPEYARVEGINIENLPDRKMENFRILKD